MIPNKLGKIAIKTGRVRKRGRYVFYGPGSIGKTTLGCSAPGVLIMSMEDGAREFDGARMEFDETTERVFPIKFDEVITALSSVQEAPSLGDIETLVIDGAHVLDALAQAKVCETNGWKTIADPGFGKGEKEVLALYRQVFSRLDDLNGRRNLRIIITGHHRVVNFKDPTSAEYGLFDLAVTKSREADVSGFIYGWSDVYAFCRFETLTRVIGKNDKARTIAVDEQGARVMHLQMTTAYVAKCRYGGPDTVSLTNEDGSAVKWAEIFADLEDKAPDRLRAEIAALVGQVDDETAAKAKAYVAASGNDVAALARGLEGLKKKIAGAGNNKEAA